MAPSDIADSAMGVIPGAKVGVRSVELRPGNRLKAACMGPASKEVITFKDEFLTVVLCLC